MGRGQQLRSFQKASDTRLKSRDFTRRVVGNLLGVMRWVRGRVGVVL